MSRLKFLILDANVIIHLHEFGIWSKLIAACDVHIPETVVGESNYYEVEGEKKYIDIKTDIDGHRVHVFDIELAKIKAFRDRFAPRYLEGLDPGETEALTYLFDSKDNYLISSGDAIVYKVLGLLNRPDQGISLEEMLAKVGLQRNSLPWPCTKKFREKFTRIGQADAIQGVGLKK